MIYLDTSALIKIYIDEPGRDLVIDALNKEKIWATHVISYIETHATFARLCRMNLINTEQFDTLKKEFQTDWEKYFQINTTQTLLERAAILAETFELRAYDSAHLAAAQFLMHESHQAVLFACFDKKLNHAALALGLSLLESR